MLNSIFKEKKWMQGMTCWSIDSPRIIRKEMQNQKWQEATTRTHSSRILWRQTGQTRDSKASREMQWRKLTLETAFMAHSMT